MRTPQPGNTTTPAFPGIPETPIDEDDVEAGLDEIKEEEDESSDDDRDRKSRKKATWPIPIKDGESDEWSELDWRSYCARVKLAVLKYGPEGEKVMELFKRTPYYHMVEKIWRNHINSNNDLLDMALTLPRKQKRTVIRTMDKQQVQVILRMLNAIQENIVVSRGEHTYIQELMNVKLRFMDVDASKCTIVKYKTKILSLLKAVASITLRSSK
jgi:hypothetical protein